MTRGKIIPTIVVVAYNRPQSLQRLLDSMSRAKIKEEDVTLVISLDYLNTDDVRLVAEQFVWAYGTKKLIFHEKHLGLKKHIYSCGDLSADYDSIIVLEDDLVVSPCFFDYAMAAANFYYEEASIASISLYSYSVAEFDLKPFYPQKGIHDTYFMQVPSSWGQLWTKMQWNRFCLWRDQGKKIANELPAGTRTWSEQSWKKVFYQYLLDNNLYIVYPYQSLTTNFHEIGTHIAMSNVDFQVPLQLAKKEYSFSTHGDTHIQYDGWFEPTRELLDHMAPHLMKYDYEVDLKGTKTSFRKDIVLTSKYGVNPIRTWSDKMQPLELNIINNIEGKELGLYDKSNLLEHDKSVLGDKHLSLGVVIVVKDYVQEELNNTLNSIEKQSHDQTHVCIVCPDNIYQNIGEYISHFTAQSSCYFFMLRTEKTGLFAMALEGLLITNTDLLFWIEQGSRIRRQVFGKISGLFSFFPLASVAYGVFGEEKDLGYRWNQKILHACTRKKKMFPSTEGFIFRASVFNALDTAMVEQGENNVHLHFLTWLTIKYTLNFVKSDKWINHRSENRIISSVGTEGMEQLPFGLLTSMVLNLYWRFGKRDNKYIQGLFYLALELPLLFAYDEKNKTYYQTAY